ncbi:xanthine dehydrogenase family protein molybdopterin-binding subunit [Nocardiopsis sp. CNR-923]|uniref:xanthine dehydrogenase family protein molybdopterin-binding subunit n=1 Tax=Nocardiopsis sp. CNR-923 TaxID=1904965 RepID=UPI002916BFB2|nr:xanthine dehydrogenase family protein molybdopterin-binding subunit [Nocardiopsis sp. CNR-923]
MLHHRPRTDPRDRRVAGAERAGGGRRHHPREQRQAGPAAVAGPGGHGGRHVAERPAGDAGRSRPLERPAGGGGRRRHVGAGGARGLARARGVRRGAADGLLRPGQGRRRPAAGRPRRAPRGQDRRRGEGTVRGGGQRRPRLPHALARSQRHGAARDGRRLGRRHPDGPRDDPVRRRVRARARDAVRARPGEVRVLAGFVGGAFGGKWGVWTNTPLCAAAARIVGRPVKLVLSREEVFRLVGGRPRCEQRVALGADRDGRFTALVHTGVGATTAHARYPEQFSLTPRHLWKSRTVEIGQRMVYLDTVANSWMRAPGETVGTFALESAVDELAHELGMDPIELRRLNEPERDPTTGREFSSRNLVEAYGRGAQRFGWRDRRPRSRRDGSWLVGQGVATAYFPVFRFPATARVRIASDGTAVIRTAANEMGMGTATAQLQYAADLLGLPIDRVFFEYGDSALPCGALSAAGSSQTASAAAAVSAAVDKAHRELLRLAGGGSPLAGAGHEAVQARDGGLYRTDDRRGETYGTILERAGQECVEVESEGSEPTELAEYSMASYGAQFCEVRVHERTGEVHVSRWLGSFDCGRILNPRTAASQLRGGIVMGIGAALTEEVVFDDRTGRVVNRSLAGYHVPAHLDVPYIDVVCTDVPDQRAPLGARGVAEIGITGAAAAIANAVFNATGKRVRELPIRLDALL